MDNSAILLLLTLQIKTISLEQMVRLDSVALLCVYLVCVFTGHL